MEDRRGDKPWYLTDRARWLAYIYFTQDENIRVDEVSDLDVGVDLLVRPGVGREEEGWIMGVVTDGAVSLPEQTKSVGNKTSVPRSELDVSAFSELPHIPVFLAYYSMSEDQGYGPFLLNCWMKGSAIKSLFPNLADRQKDMVGPLFPLNEANYRLLVDLELHQTLFRSKDRGVSASSAEERDWDCSADEETSVITSLFFSRTSPAA